MEAQAERLQELLARRQVEDREAQAKQKDRRKVDEHYAPTRDWFERQSAAAKLCWFCHRRPAQGVDGLCETCKQGVPAMEAATKENRIEAIKAAHEARKNGKPTAAAPKAEPAPEAKAAENAALVGRGKSKAIREVVAKCGPSATREELRAAFVAAGLGEVSEATIHRTRVALWGSGKRAKPSQNGHAPVVKPAAAPKPRPVPQIAGDCTLAELKQRIEAAGGKLAVHVELGGLKFALEGGGL